MVRIWLGLLLLLAVGEAQAVEVRANVMGRLVLDSAGHVTDYAIDTPLGPEVSRLLDRTVRQWAFAPVFSEDAEESVVIRMHLTLAATKQDDGSYLIRLQAANFFPSDARNSVHSEVPRYPRESFKYQLNANVLVAMRVNPQGQVVDAVAVKSWLSDAKGSPYQAARLLRPFEDSALEASPKWTFSALPVGAEQRDMTILIRVTFYIPLDGKEKEPEGIWRQTVAGRTRPVPWLDESMQSVDIDGLAEGDMLVLDTSIKLLTPVVGTVL